MSHFALLSQDAVTFFSSCFLVCFFNILVLGILGSSYSPFSSLRVIPFFSCVFLVAIPRKCHSLSIGCSTPRPSAIRYPPVSVCSFPLLGPILRTSIYLWGTLYASSAGRLNTIWFSPYQCLANVRVGLIPRLLLSGSIHRRLACCHI